MKIIKRLISANSYIDSRDNQEHFAYVFKGYEEPLFALSSYNEDDNKQIDLYKTDGIKYYGQFGMTWSFLLEDWVIEKGEEK